MEQNHIINKVVIEVSVSNQKTANEIKDNISSFLAIDVFPKIEKHLHTVQAAFPSHALQISRIGISLDENKISLDSVLKDTIVQSFKKELSEKIKSISGSVEHTSVNSEVTVLAEEESLLNSFIHFAERGYMPWWNSNNLSTTILEAEVFKKIISSKAFVSKIVYSIQKPAVRERIINQLTDIQIKQICNTIIKTKNLKIVLKDTSIKQLSGQSSEERRTFWSLILNVVSGTISVDDLSEYITKEVINIFPSLKTGNKQEAVEQIWKQILTVFPFIKQNDKLTIVKNKNRNVVEKEAEKYSSLKEIIEKADIKKTPEDKTIEETGYYVQNAGLVLIHPFINNLFKYCNLIDPETKKLSDPEVCIHLLHYIATGKTNQPESNMLFEKFLCDIPLHQSISRHIKLSRKHKSEAAKVIAAVQENWSSMKTASVGLLQNEFFQRPGKLILNNTQTLTIESKTQDIFLDKLSWGIGFIKLPWHKQYIYVNW